MVASAFHFGGDSSRRRRGGCRCGRLRLGGGTGRFRLDDIDAALEVRAILDDDARRADVAHQARVLADLDLIRAFHIALNGAQRNHFTRLDTGMDVAIGTDGELVLQQLDGALQVSIDIQIFLAEDLADDLDSFPDAEVSAKTTHFIRIRSPVRHRPAGATLSGRPLMYQKYRSFYVLIVAILAAIFADRHIGQRGQQTCDEGTKVCTCNGGDLPQGNGEALRVVGACSVQASATPYKFGDVNIYGSGASLTFVDPGDKSTTDFWASSILVESKASLNAGSSASPYGGHGAVLTIHLWGADQGTNGSGIVCQTDPICGIPQTIWDHNGSTLEDLPGGVQDYFYQYKPLTYDGSNPQAYFGYKVLGVSYNGTLALHGAKGSVQDPQPASYWAPVGCG